MNDQSWKFERAAPAVYFLAFLFLALPLIDFVMSVWPLQLDKVNWRYGAFGLAGGFLLTPLLGLVMLMVTAHVVQQKGILRITGILSALTALGLLLLSMAFVLDSLQMRSGVPADQKVLFDAGVLKALLKDFTGALSSAMVAFASFRGSSAIAVSSKREPASPLVVGAREKPGSSRP